MLSASDMLDQVLYLFLKHNPRSSLQRYISSSCRIDSKLDEAGIRQKELHPQKNIQQAGFPDGHPL